MPDQINVAMAKVSTGGAPLPDRLQDKLHRVEVDLSVHLPGMATLEFYDEDLSLAGDQAGVLAIGKDLEVKFQTDEATATSVFKGRILAVEPSFQQGEKTYCNFVVTAYDKLHWAHRGRKTQNHVNVKDSDLARQIAGTYGLTPAVEATSETHEIVLRDNMSDFEFLKFLANRNGYVCFVEDGTNLVFKPPKVLGKTAIGAEFGVNCLEFRPRVTLSGQVNSVDVRGWDPKTKQAIVGNAANVSFKPVEIGLGKRGNQFAQEAMNGARAFAVTEPVNTTNSATSTAQAILDRLASEDVTAEGVLLGDPKVKPGVMLQLSAVSQRFNGKYFVTRVRHTLDQQASFMTEFWVGGMNSGTLASLVAEDVRNPVEPRRPLYGLMVGIVTQTQDPEKMFRVKVKFPTLDEQMESFWVPVMGLGAGNNRGLMILPEINDEVLVAFEHGDFNRPYVLGGVWNKIDQPPTAQDDTSKDGKTEVREWKTRAGHVIRLTDESGKEKIEVIDKASKNKLVIDTANNTITIEADKDIVLNAKTGAIKLTAQTIEMDAKQKVSAKAPEAKVEATGPLQLKGGVAELSASGNTKISGAMVMIN